MKVSKADYDHALAMIRKFCGSRARYGTVEVVNPGKPGQFTTARRLIPKTVYGVVRHVSRSGMQRRIDFYTVHKGQLEYLTGYFGNLLGIPRHREGGLIINGCGMDMVFDTVYNVARTVYGDGNRLRSDCL